MSFLDRFRPAPRWKSPDPAIRAAAVSEIPDGSEHHSVLVELATEDEDARVRRNAGLRLSRATDLVPVVRRERDPELRRELSERLVGIACAAAETDGEAALALEGLEDQRQLATVAESSPHDTVRTAALGRVHDPKALGHVARHAADPQIAAQAAARVVEPGELLNIALKTEHRDAGTAALERAVEAMTPVDARETLESVGTRARSKAVSRRARAMIQGLDDAEAARRAALEAWQGRVAAVVARVDALAAAGSTPDAARQLADSEREWQELTADATFATDPDTVLRFEGGVEGARAAIAAHEREQAERRAAEEHRAAMLTARSALCERVEAIRGDAALERVEEARAEWDGLGAVEQDPEFQALRGRFEEACQAAIDRHANRLELQRAAGRLDELSQDADRISSEETLNEEAWTAVTREWDALHAKADALDETVAARYAAAVGRVQARDAERRAAAERALRQHQQRIEQLIERAQKRAAAEDLTLREADRIARDLRTAIEAPPVPGERDHHATVERLKAALTGISPRLHELREMDEWKRFANAAVQEELIARTEALRVKYNFDAPEGPKEQDLEKIARELHDIQERWKTVAEAPRAQAQALWHRYRQAADPVQVKVREFFAHRGEERKGNLDRKMALIERAEALADSTDWIKTADELKRLQAEWQQIGPVPRQETKTTWKRFRDACDRFFTRRQADLAERKETWAANLARKEALCARAEELAASTEWERAASEIRRLQAEWKTIGPVRRNKSEAIWGRFRTACDTFFERYKHRDEIDLQSKQADREGLVSELESLAPGEGSAAASAEGLLEQVRSLRSRWNQTTPVVRHGADPLSARFVTALERIITGYPDSFRGTELDIEANRQKMEKLCVRVEGFVADAAAQPASSSQALAEMLREALAANTIGGRAGEEAKWRAMAEDVRQAQAAFSRLGPVPGDAGRALTDRFHRATSRFFDVYRRKVPQAAQAQRGGRPVPAR
jgi:hypothetical protein